MKKQLFQIMILLVFSVPFFSANVTKVTLPMHVRKTKALHSKKPTITELGDFEYGTEWYSVWGDASTGVITEIRYWEGGDVTSFSGSYYSTGYPIPNGTNPYLSLTGTGKYGYFSYTGPIQFA